MRSRTFPLVLLAVAALGMVSAISAADEQAQIDFANGLFARGFNVEASEEYRKYLKDYADGAHAVDALYRLGEAELAQSRHSEALVAFDQLLQRFPKDALAPVAQGRKGVALYNLKRFDDAVATLAPMTAGTVAPETRGAALYFLGKAHFDAKRAPEAIAAFNTLIETQPESPYAPAARYQLAYAYLAQQNLEQAAIAFSELAGMAGAKEELRREARFRAGEVYDKLGWYDAAVRSYEQLQADFPGTDHAQRAAFGHAWSLYHAGRFEDAAALGEQFLQANAQSPQAVGLRYLIANCLQQLGKRDEALAAYREVLKLDPKSDYAIRAQYKEGYLLHAAGDLEGATTALEVFLKRDGKTGLEADACYLLGMGAYQRARLDEAAVHFQRCLDSATPGTYRIQAAYQLAQTRFDQGQFADARDRFASFAAEHGDDPLALQALLRAGDGAFHAGDYAGADTLYSQAVDKSEGELREEALYRVAVARHNGDKPAESAQAFERLLAEFPASAHGAEAHVRAGQYWLAQGKEPIKAIPHFEAALSASADGPFAGEATKGLGLARYESKDLDGAAQTFVKLIQGWPSVSLNESAYAWAGQYLFDKEKWDASAVALQALLDHVADYPDKPRVRLKIGECAERADRLDEALKRYESIAADAPQSAAADEARYRSAGIYEKKNQLDRAAEIYEKVSDSGLNGDIGARAQFRLGELRQGQGKFPEAARHFMRVAILYLHPALSPEALWRAGQCFEQGGDKDQAVKTYQEVVRDHPETEQAGKAKERLAALAA